MVELARKFPSANMLERLATALEIEPHELFYMPGVAEKALENLQNSVLASIEQKITQLLPVVH